MRSRALVLLLGIGMAMRLPSNGRMSNAPNPRKRLPSSANRANAKNQRMHDPQRCHAYHPLKARVYLSTLTVANGRCPLFYYPPCTARM